MIVGTNAAEAAALVTEIIGPTLNASAYTEIIRLVFGSAAGLIEYAYPVSDYKSAWWALEAILTDALFVCPARRSVRWFSKYNIPSYLYSFSHTPSVTVVPKCTAPCHTTELPYVFHVQPLLANKAESELSNTVVQYWSSFANNLVPKSENQPSWPQYMRLLDRSIDLNITISVTSGLRMKTCNFWDVVQKFMPSDEFIRISTNLMARLRKSE